MADRTATVSRTSTQVASQITRKSMPAGAQAKSSTCGNKHPEKKPHAYRSRNANRGRHYLTSGHEHLGPARNVIEEQSPFAFPECSLTFGYFQYSRQKQRMADMELREASLNQQHNYKTRQARDVLQRLRVDVELEAEEAKKHKDLDKAIAITDVHPEYFTELAGRVVKEKFSLHNYVQNNREVFKTRLLTDQERDDCIRIDQQFEEEQARLDRIREDYRQYVSGFEEFLSRDHESSMQILEKADREARLTNELTERRNRLTKKYGQVRLDVYFWEENWRLVKMCQEFLRHVSSTSSRLEEMRSKSAENIVCASANDLFARFRKAEKIESLDTLIEMFELDASVPAPTEKYFEDPYELIAVFRSMETQNLNALIHLESLAAPMMELTTTIVAAEAQIKSEVREIVDVIEDLEDSIKETETRAASLEEKADRLVNEVFRYLVSSPEVLCLQVYIEDAYENCVGPNDANLDSFSMMKWIEKTYEGLNLQLDNLPPELIEYCEKEGLKQELKAMREIEEAGKKFELMRRLLEALKRALEPPPEKRRQVMWRSPPNVRKAAQVEEAPVPTEEELQYLAFFTEYCKHEDFTTYRSQFPDDFDLTFERRKPLTDPDEYVPSQ